MSVDVASPTHPQRFPSTSSTKTDATLTASPNLNEELDVKIVLEAIPKVEPSANPIPRKDSQGRSHLRNWVSNPHKTESTRCRTLVLCFDGTGDHFDTDNSNVVQFVAALKKDDPKHQVVYYQAGIGTYTRPQFITPLAEQTSKVLDEMFAWNLSTHVMQGYEFLMQNYTDGDKISLFGFSRGAYTARALAGMIQKVGLLPAYNHQQIPFAWTIYAAHADKKISEEFKNTFSIDVQIDFVGVWDTVASVGLFNAELPFVDNNHAIRVFRHALALDEHRAKFMPNFYHVSKDKKKHAGDAENTKHSHHHHKGGKAKELQIAESEPEPENTQTTTDSKEVWFAGCHCDVGGGSVKNGTLPSLARIPLRWMIRECFASQTGIIFDSDILKKQIGINVDSLHQDRLLARPPRKPAESGDKIQPPQLPPNPTIQFILTCGKILWIPISFVLKFITVPIKHLWDLVRFSAPINALKKKFSWSKKSDATQPSALDTANGHDHVDASSTDEVNEEHEEHKDALSAMYDQLELNRWWWILEILPFKFRKQKDSRADYYVRCNYGRGRLIYGDALDGGVLIHRSVKTRLEVLDKHKKSHYRPNAWFKSKSSKWWNNKSEPQEWNIDNPTLWTWVD